jgi:hypothetical protein
MKEFDVGERRKSTPKTDYAADEAHALYDEVQPEIAYAPGPGKRAECRTPAQLFADNCEQQYQWAYEGGDLIPWLLTETEGWKSAGLTLEIHQAGCPVVRYDACGDATKERHPNSIIRIQRVNDNHYVFKADDKLIDVGNDGNCFFLFGVAWLANAIGFSHVGACLRRPSAARQARSISQFPATDCGPCAQP